MTHTVTGKLNKVAGQHQGAQGVVFFVDLGESNYNRKTKQKEWTNYSAALFAKDAQIQFYTQALVEGSVISVTGSGIILDMPSDPQYKPRLVIQDAKLVFVSSGQQASQQPQQQAPQQRPQQAPAQQAAQQAPQQAPAQGYDNFDSDIPF